MRLTIFRNGQLFIGLIEYKQQQESLFVEYVFGTEPDSETTFKFINQRLLKLIGNSKASTKAKKSKNKINPKKLQRKVAKEQKKHPVTTQSQQALKKERKLRKELSRKRDKLRKEIKRKKKRRIEVLKAEEEHKGH